MIKKRQKLRLLRLPVTFAELETQLPDSLKSLDAGKGVKGEEVFRRLRKRIKGARHWNSTKDAIACYNSYKNASSFSHPGAIQKSNHKKNNRLFITSP